MDLRQLRVFSLWLVQCAPSRCHITRVCVRCLQRMHEHLYYTIYMTVVGRHTRMACEVMLRCTLQTAHTTQTEFSLFTDTATNHRKRSKISNTQYTYCYPQSACAHTQRPRRRWHFTRLGNCLQRTHVPLPSINSAFRSIYGKFSSIGNSFDAAITQYVPQNERFM